jgi:hypothetical protein
MERAGIFEDFSVEGFEPVKPAAAPPQEAVRKVSERTRKRSREPENAPQEPVKRKGRVYRTGRNRQLNIRVRDEDFQAFLKSPISRAGCSAKPAKGRRSPQEPDPLENLNRPSGTIRP